MLGTANQKYVLCTLIGLGIIFCGAAQTHGNATQQMVTSLPAKECDLTGYTPAVIRKIRRHWHPLAGDRTKRVVVDFQISSDGRLVNTYIKDSSDSDSANDAALEAVKSSVPFKLFPIECQDKDLPMEFTFGYQAVGHKLKGKSL